MPLKTTHNQIQTALLFIIILLFAVGTLIQITDQREHPSVIIHYRSLNTPDDIVPLSHPVQAVAYTSVISLEKLPVADKKQHFIALLLPAILISKQQHQQQRLKLEKIITTDHPSHQEQAWLQQRMTEYDVQSATQLKQRLIDLPNSLILAQAALETGWGSSRFFVQANNIFGIWSFDADEPRIMARQRRSGTAVYVKRYDSLIGSIDDYFVTLGRGNAYRELRQAASKSQNSLKLINHLQHYSEQGEDYIERLKTLIQHNDLTQYDHYRL